MTIKVILLLSISLFGLENSNEIPEIIKQPILFKGTKKGVLSLNNIKVHEKNESIELMIDFKGNYKKYSRFLNRDNIIMKLISYEILKEENNFKFNNRKYHINYDFPYFKIITKSDNPNYKIYSMKSNKETRKEGLYNYIRNEKNKAWQIIIILEDMNKIIIELKTKIFLINKKGDFELYNEEDTNELIKDDTNELNNEKDQNNKNESEKIIKITREEIKEKINNSKKEINESELKVPLNKDLRFKIICVIGSLLIIGFIVLFIFYKKDLNKNIN